MGISVVNAVCERVIALAALLPLEDCHGVGNTGSLEADVIFCDVVWQPAAGRLFVTGCALKIHIRLVTADDDVRVNDLKGNAVLDQRSNRWGEDWCCSHEMTGETGRVG